MTVCIIGHRCMGRLLLKRTNLLKTPGDYIKKRTIRSNGWFFSLSEIDEIYLLMITFRVNTSSPVLICT